MSVIDIYRHTSGIRLSLRKVAHGFARVACVCAGAAGLSGLVYADEWSATPSLQLRTQYDDNLYLSADTPIDTWGYTASPIMLLGRRTPASKLELEGRLIFNHYSESSVTDPNVQSLKLQGQINSRRSTWGVRSSFKRDTTTATVIDVQGEDQDAGAQDGDVDTNLVETQVRRNQLRMDPFFSYRLTEKTSVRLRYGLNRTAYSDEGATSLFDYKRQSAEVGLSHALDRTNRLSVTATTSNYEAPDADTDTDDYVLRGSWSHNYATDLRGDMSFGFRSVSSSQGGEQIDSTGAVFNASLVKKYSELATYRVEVERNLQPSGAGVMVQKDSLKLDFSRNLTSRLSFSVAVNAYRNQSADFFSSSVDRTYYTVEPQLGWQITRLWSLDGSYQYRWQEYDEREGSASGNAVFMAIDYAWPKMAVSR